MTTKAKRQPMYWVILIMAIAIQWGCAAPQSVSLARPGCTESDNLLVDTGFTLTREADQRWQLSQHTGPRSFQLTPADGALRIERIGDEPWMLLTQQVTLPELDPDQRYTLEMSAELKGNVQTEPELHGFEHKAGLFIRSGAASMAEHEPNSGVWDWQRVDMSVAPLPGSKSVQAGFLHQGGGTLWARDPSLKLVGCDA